MTIEIKRTGMRLRRQEFRGRPLALEIRDAASGRLLRTGEALAAGVAGIGGVIASAASRVLAIIKPEMITSERLSFNVMKKPVTVAMFRQFVEDSGYRIVGHNADKLTALLAGAGKNEHGLTYVSLTYVSYDDTTAFVNWRKEKTGENLRLPTEDEWLAAKREVGNQLTGNLWEWTQTIYSGIARVLRSLDSDYRINGLPVARCNLNTVRLVEDLK